MSDKTKPPGVDAAHRGADLDQLEPQAQRSASTVDTPPGRHRLAESSYHVPAYLERLAFARVLRHVAENPEAFRRTPVEQLRALTGAALIGVVEHIAVQDERVANLARRVGELTGQLARITIEREGLDIAEDVRFERTADAADGMR